MSNSIDINSPVGVIDSGIGGLTVLRELVKVCPNEQYVYIGDDINSPYGQRDAADIQTLSLLLCKRPLLSQIKVLVIACNTITAVAIDVIREHSKVPVIGVIDSGVEECIKITKNNKVGILATNATVESKVFDNELKRINKDIQVTSVGAPNMHLYAENSLDLVMNDPTPQIKQCVKDYVTPFIDAGCDTILLACTHFPPFEYLIREVVGDKVNIVSPSKLTALELKNVLEKNNMLSKGKGSYKIYSTAHNEFKYEKFQELIMK